MWRELFFYNSVDHFRVLSYVHTLRLIWKFSYLVHVIYAYEGNKMYSWENTMYFRVWIIKLHSPGYEVDLINRSV